MTEKRERRNELPQDGNDGGEKGEVMRSCTSGSARASEDGFERDEPKTNAWRKPKPKPCSKPNDEKGK